MEHFMGEWWVAKYIDVTHTQDVTLAKLRYSVQLQMKEQRLLTSSEMCIVQTKFAFVFFR